MSQIVSSWIIPVAMIGLLCTQGANALVQTSAPSGYANRESFGGVWSLNRDKSAIPDRSGLEGGRGARQEGDGPQEGGRRGGFGGGFRGGRGTRGDDGGNEERMKAIMSYMRSLMEASDRLTIVVNPTSVGITDSQGRTIKLQTDSKRFEERAENGLVKLTRKNRWDGPVLVAEIEIDEGPKIERRYELSAGGDELRVSTTTSGGFGRGGGGGQPMRQVYERWREQ